MKNFKEVAMKSNYARKLINEDNKNGAYYRWLNKEVIKDKTIFFVDNNVLEHIIGPEYGSISIVNYNFETSKKALLLKTNIDVENIDPRPKAGIVINVGKDGKGLDISGYNRVKLYVYLKGEGIQNMYFHFQVGNDGSNIYHTASIYANELNTVIWEIGEVERNDVKNIIITPYLFGCPSEGLGDVSIYISDIKVEKVKEDYVLGWNLEDRIAYSHVGYFKNNDKVAILSNMNNLEFNIVNDKEKIVYSGLANKIDTELGKFYELNFSALNKSGKYYIQWDDKKTPIFEISKNPYLLSVLASLNFLRCLRCGEDIMGVHSACHLNCKSFDSNGNSVPVFGGWHDAGDLSQFEIPTAEITHALCDLAFSIKDNNLKIRIMEEAKVGGDWLLRTSFHNGDRALAISYKLWRNNLLKSTNKDVYNNKSENGPFENFLSAAALASLAMLYKDDYKIYSDWCLRIAKEDFINGYDGYENGIYTKRWGSNIDACVCGHGIIASCELYKMTKDQEYINIAKKYANIVLLCQESTYHNWTMPIRGFFYEDIEHKYMLTFEHRGHEQSPIQGLCALYNLCPNDADSAKWLEGIKLYREYILSTINLTKPYGILPGHIYDINKLNMERFTLGGIVKDKEEGLKYLQKEASSGKKLADGVYLRAFPIAIQRRGFHATLLSKTKGVACIAKVLKDKQLMKIVIDQFEWIFGKNPFASSTMYGIGYNYHPLYMAYSKQIVGALPVGIMTKGDLDLPYWPTYNNAVFKEIWGHTTAKYLWTLADIIEYNTYK